MEETENVIVAVQKGINVNNVEMGEGMAKAISMIIVTRGETQFIIVVFVSLKMQG